MDTTKSITLGQAFAHCASTSSYWIWIAIAVLASVACFIIIYRIQKTTEVNGYVKIILAFACVAAIVASIFLRPCDVAANTSSAAAARGNFLGY